MVKPAVAGFFGGASCLLFASLSHAQCAMDTDCKGDRVCEEGACVAPKTPPATPAAPAPAPGAPTAAPPLASGTNGAATTPLAPAPGAPPEMQRHSVGMMAGGIVMLALVPIALLVALNADSDRRACLGENLFSSSVGTNCGRFDATIYGGLITAAALTGAGIPLYAIGSKKEPVGTALISPWATRSGGGLALRIDL
jgi:hypothetical protein